MVDGIILYEIIEYIKRMFGSNDTAPVFKLTDLVLLYCRRLEHYGFFSRRTDVHSSRLKESILLNIP